MRLTSKSSVLFLSNLHFYVRLQFSIMQWSETLDPMFLKVTGLHGVPSVLPFADSLESKDWSRALTSPAPKRNNLAFSELASLYIYSVSPCNAPFLPLSICLHPHAKLTSQLVTRCAQGEGRRA